MDNLLEPLKNASLKNLFIEKFEHLILSGELKIGQKLPSERELGKQLQVSRPVVHEGLVDLEAKGLVKILPRVGAVVNDYRNEGSIPLLTSLLNFSRGNLEPGLLKSLLAWRYFFETQCARLASQQRSDQNLYDLEDIIDSEKNIDRGDLVAVTELDFRFHHQIALATGNMVYPLLMNSFKEVYTMLTSTFFSSQNITEEVYPLHRELVMAIEEKAEEDAATAMMKLLKHGEAKLMNILDSQGRI